MKRGSIRRARHSKKPKTLIINARPLKKRLLFIGLLGLFVYLVFENRMLLMDKAKSNASQSFFQSCIGNTFFVTASNDNLLYQEIKSIGSRFFGLDLDNPLSMIGTQIALAREQKAMDQEKNITAAPTSTPQPTKTELIEGQTITGQGNAGAEEIAVKNDTDLQLDIAGMKNAPLNLGQIDKNPKILIVHTHATEGYAGADRSEDDTINVVRIGQEMAAVFEKHGIKTLHDTKHHDYPSYNGSYKSSLESIQNYLNQYPSINVVLDVHRDAVSGQGLRVITDVNGKTAAQVMLVVGTNAGGLYHPNWQENMKFAVKIQENIVKNYASLARPINVRKERFNQFSAPGHLIVEVGGNANTVEEAVYAAQLTAEEIARTLKE